MNKTLIIILAVLLNWNLTNAQCLSQAGELNSAVSTPKFCNPTGGSLPVDVSYPITPVPSDTYIMMIVDDLTETIITFQGIGALITPSTVNVNIPGTLLPGTYKIYGLNVDAADPDVVILYPAGPADIIGTSLASLIANIENLGGVSGTGDICGDITITTVAFEIFETPTATFTALPDLCISLGEQTGLSGGLPTGGVYSGSGVTDDGNGMTYSFDPIASLNGIKTITYTYTNAGGCTSSSSDDVEVFGLPAVDFTAPADVCAGSLLLTGQTLGSPAGGVYSGTGVTDDGNGTSYSFDPVVAGIGVHLITYSYTDGNGCSQNYSDNIEVLALPTVTFSALAGLCLDAGVQTGLSGGLPTGGIYSGSGVIDDGNGTSYSFNPSIAGAGVQTLTYTFTNGSGCSNSSSDDVEIFTLPAVNFNAPADVCPGSALLAGQTGGSPIGGVYSGSGVSDDGNGTSFSFDPNATGTGIHLITYSYADANGCSSDASDNVLVGDATAPTASNPSNINVECVGDVPAPDVNEVSDAIDNCGTPIVTWVSDLSDGQSCPQTITRTYNVADAIGNSIDVLQLILVNDVSAPVPNAVTLPTETFSCTTTPTAPTATDNCSGSIIGVSNLIFPITSFGPATITWSYTDDCGNVSTQTQNVNILTMDVSTTILSDGKTIVANNTGGSYQWIDCGTSQPILGETGPSYTTTYDGSFAVEITKGNCFDVSACTVISTAGVEIENADNSFEIYPNPTSGSVTISSGTLFNRIEVLNTLGQNVREYNISKSNKYLFNLPDANGVYLVKIYNNESYVIKRIVKK